MDIFQEISKLVTLYSLFIVLLIFLILLFMLAIVVFVLVTIVIGIVACFKCIRRRYRRRMVITAIPSDDQHIEEPVVTMQTSENPELSYPHSRVDNQNYHVIVDFEVWST
ncbi:hypothetical protein RF11_12297 [Thelohanellus kitauei]|uniref:Uncharacterized protein n=1 Tax=Thelohanellus kitauei TaxID=669202 RepID=A0A0C2J519_THEKT|nr:hypothetical protein RF11_12297 [Thelohanellus kitauei]